jgi:hypothetical protein
MLEYRSIGIAHSWRPLAGKTTLVEQTEQAAAGERALQRPGDGGREGLAHGDAREVGEDAVGETAELQLAGADEPDQRVLSTREGVRKDLLGGARRVLALGHVVLQEPRGAVGPGLARAQRAIVRLFRRTGVGRQINRARLEQLVQLRDLGRVLLGRRPGPVDHRATLAHEPLPRLERLLLVEQRAGELLDLASLFGRRLG